MLLPCHLIKTIKNGEKRDYINARKLYHIVTILLSSKNEKHKN